MSDPTSNPSPAQTTSPQPPQPVSPPSPAEAHAKDRDATFPACPVCGGKLVDIQSKLICSRCHTICETCCEGGRG